MKRMIVGVMLTAAACAQQQWPAYRPPPPVRCQDARQGAYITVTCDYNGSSQEYDAGLQARRLAAESALSAGLAYFQFIDRDTRAVTVNGTSPVNCRTRGGGGQVIGQVVFKDAESTTCSGGEPTSSIVSWRFVDHFDALTEDQARPRMDPGLPAYRRAMSVREFLSGPQVQAVASPTTPPSAPQ